MVQEKLVIVDQNVEVPLCKFDLCIVTKVRQIKFITIRIEWRINNLQPRLHYTLPSRLYIVVHTSTATLDVHHS